MVMKDSEAVPSTDLDLLSTLSKLMKKPGHELFIRAHTDTPETAAGRG